MSKGESIWDLALAKHNAAKEEEVKGEESSVLLFGSKGAGKTSIILRFLDRDEIPKPTTGLEYTFGRRAKGANLAKDVGHIWELGGGTWLSRLIDVPLNPNSISHIGLILVLDLSKPSELWFTLEKFLGIIRSRLDAVINEARLQNPQVKDDLKKQTWERIGEEHPDRDLMDPLHIPFAIVGAKYDVFQDFDPEKRKVICKTLRFVAHTYGAHLQFISVKQESLMGKARNLISHFLFGTGASKSTQFDHNKPILAPLGSDSFQQIGSPPLADGDLGTMTARTPLDLWKKAFVTFFPQDNLSDPSMVEDPARDNQYKEASIDNLRKQKDEELERYRKLSERRAREAQRGHAEVMA